MKIRLNFFDSAWLTAILLLLIASSFLLERRMMAKARLHWLVAEKSLKANKQAGALANAIEQYCMDFPDAGPLANNHDWTERLGGHNPKNIRYLKVEKYSRDSADRLLDPCGTPWLIEVQGSPGFQPMVPDEAATEFHIASTVCPGFASGKRKDPRHPRFY